MTVNFEGKTYTLTQDAYLDSYMDGSAYFAHAIGEDGETYLIRWDKSAGYEEAQKRYKADSEDENALAYIEDESNACDWEKPDAVERA